MSDFIFFKKTLKVPSLMDIRVHCSNGLWTDAVPLYVSPSVQEFAFEVCVLSYFLKTHL